MNVAQHRAALRVRIKVGFYDPAHIPEIKAQSPAREDREWRECARWVVMFGLEFAEVFAVHSVPFELAAAS